MVISLSPSTASGNYCTILTGGGEKGVRLRDTKRRDARLRQKTPKSVMTQYNRLCVLACLPNAGTSELRRMDVAGKAAVASLTSR